MATCSEIDCELDSYEGVDKCILHCEKGNYQTDFSKAGFLNLFYEELINFIINFVFEYTPETNDITREVFRAYIQDGAHHNATIDLAKKSTVVFTRIFFPFRKGRDAFDYLKVLKRIGNIHYRSCKFAPNSLDTADAKCFYDECVFYNNWHITRHLVLGNVSNTLYQRCEFHNNVGNYAEDGYKIAIPAALFCDCIFHKKIEFGYIDFEEPIFDNSIDNDFNEFKIEELNLIDCTLKEKFILNNYNIRKFNVTNTIVKSKFEFKNNIVEDFKVVNTNFLKLVDTHGTKFEKFSINKSIFEDFVGFEECVFGMEGRSDKDFIATFLYATFLSFVNYRGTIFYSGLDIKNINLKEPPNFLETTINPINTNRETYRIIKNSFDRSGNIIEANKFFVHEMKKYREELTESRLTQEKLIFYINEMISNFGQSYIRPIVWMFFASYVYYLLIQGYENNIIYKIYQPANNVISNISEWLNILADNILPFSHFLKDGMEFISLIFYVVFASLIWQIIIAVKRHTKR